MENVVLSIISYLRKKVVRFSLNILTSKNIHILMSYYAVKNKHYLCIAIENKTIIGLVAQLVRATDS